MMSWRCPGCGSRWIGGEDVQAWRAEGKCPRCTAAPPTEKDLAAAVLLFHAGGDWSIEKAELWRQFTGSDEATTRTLCDLARRVLELADRASKTFSI